MMLTDLPDYCQIVVPIEYSEEFIVPEGKVFLIKVRYENHSPYGGPKYEESTFMINRENKLRKIMSHNEDNPWHPVDDYRDTKITYLDGSRLLVFKSCDMDFEPSMDHEYIDSLLFRKQENDFLRKAFNAMLINYDSKSEWQLDDLEYEETPYACYVYIPNYRVFVAKMSNEVLPGEQIFLGEIDTKALLDYYQSKPNLINEEYFRKFLHFESIGNKMSFVKLLSKNHPMHSDMIKDYSYYFTDFKLDLARLKLKEMNIDAAPNIPYSKYW